MRQRIGILVATAPDAGDFASLDALLAGALRDGAEVGIFLMDDGVGWAADPRLLPFLAAGVEVSLCAMDAEERGLDCRAAAAAGVILGGQPDHARLLRDSERFYSFT